MEPPKLHKLISVMYLDIITGDVHTRNQYLNIFLTHVSECIRAEYLEKHQSEISKFRTRLHNTVQTILQNNHPLPAWDTQRADEIANLMHYFDRFVFRVDSNVADETGLLQMGILEDIETIEHCRNVCYSASADYSGMMAGEKEGLTNASNKYAYVVNLIIPVLYRYSLVEFSDADYTNAARVAARKTPEATK